MRAAPGTPIRSRLLLSFLLVLLAGMGLAAGLTWAAVEQMYLSTQRENLQAQAELAAAQLQGAPLPAQMVQPYSQLSNVQPGIHMRLLGEQGAVLVGLPLPAAGARPAPAAENPGYTPPEELVQRPEILQAMQGQAATAVRRVAAAGGRRVLYAAAPVYGPDGQIQGLAYFATPLPAGGLPGDLAWRLIGGLLAAVLLAGVTATWLARRLALPVETVACAAHAVSAGDLSQQVPVGGPIRELNGLGQAFNEMTASLRQADQARNAFIADVTHELRTPLTVIKGTIETLEDGALDDAEGRGPLLVSMQRETERLIRLVNDLLVLARADAGALKLDLRLLDPGALARARCAHLSTLAAQRQVALQVNESSSAPGCQARGDADRLAQVFDNLLDNAIRHSPAGSTILVNVCPSGSQVACMVSDQGEGIPAEHLPFIFDRFYRVDSSRNRRTGGAGLGLAIARTLVLAQGGRIEAHSTPGQGTQITFYLPAEKR